MMRAPHGRRAATPTQKLSGSVAQLVEQYPFKVLVLGSSPSRPTIVLSRIFKRARVLPRPALGYPELFHDGFSSMR
jgi:hypothetical protein